MWPFSKKNEEAKIVNEEAKIVNEEAKIVFDKRSIWAQKAMEGFPYRAVKYADDADLIWTTFPDYELYKNLSGKQLINHPPHVNMITNKGNLFTCLSKFDQHNTGPIKMNSFIPESYRLYIPSDVEAFLQKLSNTNEVNQPWILKPTNLSAGRGVIIFDDYDDIREFCKNPRQSLLHLQSTADQTYMIQKYLKNPLLLDERKSETRIYWLIACHDPLLVFMYSKGIVRLNTLPYELANFDNQLIHITNVYQQETHAFYDPYLQLKWDFNTLDSHIANEFNVQNFIRTRFWPRIRECLTFVVHATIKRLFAEPNYGFHFGFFGADIIIDSDLNPWLIEVQMSPGLSFKDPIKKRLIPSLIQDTCRIMLEIQKRKRSGASFEDLDIGDYLWVIGDKDSK